MLKQHARAVDLATRLFDLVALAVALPLAHLAHGLWRAAPAHDLPDEYWSGLVVVMVTWVAAASGFRVYDTFRTRSVAEELGRILRAVAVAALVVVAAAFAAKEHGLPRLLVGFWAGISFALVGGARVALRLLARALRARGYNSRRYAIVGTGEEAELVAATFRAQPSWGYVLAGHVLAHEREQAPAGATVLGTIRQLGKILETEVLDEVVFAVSREQLPQMDAAVLLCEEQGVAVRVSLGGFRVGAADMSVLDLSGHPMLVFTRTSSDVFCLLVKRLFDVAVSAAVLLVTAPVLATVAVAIRLESKGPVLFRQRRVGLNGRQFWCWKFRSMHLDAEQRLEALRSKNEMTGPVFKMRDDPRVTRVGKFIRKTSLDEFPQFWNVLRGEMSVVGPRPPVPAEVRQYKRWQRRRLSVKPGITCTWQVSGRNQIDFDRWMELDLEYIDGWSLWRDIEICARTIPAVLSARGAR